MRKHILFDSYCEKNSVKNIDNHLLAFVKILVIKKRYMIWDNVQQVWECE